MIQIDDTYVYKNVALYIIDKINNNGYYNKPFITIYYISKNKLCCIVHNYKHFEIIDRIKWDSFAFISDLNKTYCYNKDLFFKYKLEIVVPEKILNTIIKNNRNENLNELLNIV